MMNNFDFRPAMIFQDNMVLQRDKPVFIWGEGPENCVVTAEIQNRKEQVLIKNGKWVIKLPPLRTSVRETMELSCEGRCFILENICIGEVWVAGGQSNMEFFIRYDEERNTVLESGINDNIRFFDYPEVSYPSQINEYDYSRYGLWRICDSANLEYFSAVGYYFASKLEQDLGVPVGIIGCNWGGTPACAWMSTKYLESNEGRVWLEDYNNALEGLDIDAYKDEFVRNTANIRNDLFSDTIAEKMMFGMSPAEQAEFMQSTAYSADEPPAGPWSQNRPGGLYETMLSKVAPFSTRGIIWYQGESDDKHPDVYDTVLSSLIRSWRALWNEELPFLFVQLAPFRKWLHCLGETYPVIRERQERVSKTVPGTWMASIMDSGMEFDIHPKKKRPVGERLALLAEGRVYSMDILCESPGFTGASISNGEIILSFNNTGDGLRIKGEGLDSLVVYLDAESIKGYGITMHRNEIIITDPRIAPGRDIAVAYAYSDYCRVNLYNSAGLPVKPFRYGF